MSIIPAAQFTPAHVSEIRQLASTLTAGGAPGFWSTGGYGASFAGGQADRVSSAIAQLALWGYVSERTRYDEEHSFSVVSASMEPMTAEEWQAVSRVTCAAGGPLQVYPQGRDLCGMDFATATAVRLALAAAGWRVEFLDGHYPDGSGPLRILGPRPVLVVTRHPALVEYLRETGVVSESAVVLAHVETPDQIRDRRVVGVLPLHLASVCQSVTEVPMALQPADREAMQRGDLSLERVRQVAGAPQTYVVRRRGA